MRPNPRLQLAVTDAPSGSGAVYAERYAGTLDDGTEFTGKSLPFDACRHLQAQGVTGKLDVFGPDGGHRMVIGIAKGASLSVSEGEKSGPTFIKYRPFSRPV